MQMNSAEICSLLKEKIENFSGDSTASNQGKVLTAGDGVVRISGLEMAQQGEIVNIEQVARALVMNLEQDWIGAVILGDASEVAEGMRVESTSKVLDVPVGPELLGRVINALGEPLDNLGPINAKKRAPIERLAPGVLSRKAVRCPLQTGYKAVDAMVPIGKGQRELIIGDRQTGKTSLALDTILNQKHSGVRCIYVAIGQKASTVAELVGHLQKNDAMKYTTVMVASAADCAAMQYIAPYAACSIGEYFRDRGEHALIVYDDLSKHAVAYRQLSLLLRRPPGREAFPGDVFYLHARLLERAASVNRAFIQSQNPAVELDPAIEFGSLTALPIIETQAGDISAFVPTNVISITDGQLFLDTDLFNSGVRPAINPGISVSRIGGAAQHPFIQKFSGKLRTALAQYRELQSFSQFASDLDASTKTQLKEGEIITLLLKQGQYAPLRASEQVMILAAINNGLAFELEKENVAEFENALLEYVRHYYASFLDELDGAESADPLTFSKIMDILSSFQKTEVF